MPSKTKAVIVLIILLCRGMLANSQSTVDQQARRPNEGAQPMSQGGVNTGPPQHIQLDEKHRPITAGGFVASGPVIFRDMAGTSGLSGWTHTIGDGGLKYIVETLGSGVGLIDFDNDGWLDIYLVNGSTYEAETGKAAPPHAALFRNNHDGTFTNVAAAAGVQNDRWGTGVAVADFDNDGWPDLFVSNFGANRLYRNNHDGTFTDVAKKAGVALGNWSTGATWGDYDNDGRLDLFVPGYVHYDPQHPLSQTTDDKASVSFCQFRGVHVMCGPRGLPGEPDHLFHNNGDGTFTDVSEKAGVSDKKTHYYGLASLFVDVNNDGKVDLLVANDSTPNYLYLNKGDGTFEDASFASGYAFNESGRETASMGIAVGDTTHRGLLDVFNTTFSDDYKPFYRNEGDGNFTDVSYQMKIAEPTIPFLGWGTAFFDYDNDGWLDLMFVNGHVYPQADQHPWGTSFMQRPFLFHSQAGRMVAAPAVEGTGLAELHSARGMAYGDLFNDGKLDVVVNNLNSPPSLLRNVSRDTNHWIALKLVGGERSPKDATGSVVYLTVGAVRQRSDVISGGSFASSSDKRIHFGLGKATKVDDVEVHWPSGLVEHFTEPTVDGLFVATEGTGKANSVARTANE